MSQIIYMSLLGKIRRTLGIQYLFCADDSQIYVTFMHMHTTGGCGSGPLGVYYTPEVRVTSPQ